MTYGVVVDSVNVSVFAYVPVRSGSFAAIGCLKSIATLSLDTGAEYVLTVDGSGVPATCSGEASANAPVTSRPVAVELGSAAVSVASPAVETTVAVVVAEYSFARPGVNAPNAAGVPSVSDSVAGTDPPTAASWAGAPCTAPLDVVTIDASSSELSCPHGSAAAPVVGGWGSVAPGVAG